MASNINLLCTFLLFSTLVLTAVCKNLLIETYDDKDDDNSIHRHRSLKNKGSDIIIIVFHILKSLWWCWHARSYFHPNRFENIWFITCDSYLDINISSYSLRVHNLCCFEW